MSPPQRKTELDALAVGLLLACCLFWGFQQVLVKATLPQLPPVFQAAVRFIGATVLLLLWCRWRGVRLRWRDGSAGPGLLAGLLFAAEFAAIYIGLQHTSASRLTLFLYTAPFWVAALLPLRVHNERLRPLQWLGLGCAFIAVAFALRGGSASGATTSTLLGDMLGLAAGMLWGWTTVVIRSSRLGQSSAEQMLLYQVAISALVLPLLSWGLGEAWPGLGLEWRQISAFAWVSLLLQTVVGAFASYLAWMWLLGRYPATRISVFVFLTPLFALLFGTLWLGEPLSAGLLAALALVAAGIVLVNRQPGLRS